MPYRMHSEYLRELFIGNDLSEGRFTAGGKPVFLPDIRVPAFVVATEQDHIAPWRSVWKLTYLLHGEAEFVLASGGHNTGIVAPPSSDRARFRLVTHRSGMTHADPDAIREAVPDQKGSWWRRWADWLARLDPDMGPPPPMGRADAGYPPIAPAPSAYVLG